MELVLNKELMEKIKAKELSNEEFIKVINNISLRKILEIYPVLPDKYKKNQGPARIIKKRISNITPLKLSYMNVYKKDNKNKLEELTTVFSTNPKNKNLSLLYKNVFSDINYYISEINQQNLNKNFYIDEEFYKSVPPIYLEQIIEYISKKYNHNYSKAELEKIRTLNLTANSELKKYISYIENFYYVDVDYDNKYLISNNIHIPSPMVVNETDALTEYFIRNYASAHMPIHTYIDEKVCSINNRNQIIMSIEDLYYFYDLTNNKYFSNAIVKILIEIHNQTIFNDIYKQCPNIIEMLRNIDSAEYIESEKIDCLKLRIEYLDSLKELELANKKVSEKKKQLSSKYGL